MQLSKFDSPNFNLVTLYRSQNGNQSNLNGAINQIIDSKKPILILGDFNFCAMDNSSNLTKQFMIENNFIQLIHEPTHIEGNLLDHAYIQDVQKTLDFTAQIQGRYYTDHKALHLIIKKRCKLIKIILIFHLIIFISGGD